MGKIMIVKRFEFEAAHRLPKYIGPCNRVHGHRYELEVGVIGPIDQDSGMIMDFSQLKTLVKTEIVDKLDHYYLNDLVIIGFPSTCPTAEKMVLWMADTLFTGLKELDDSLELGLMRLWETSGSYCEWRA